MPARRKETDAWALTTWEGAESEILAVGVRMTLAERLRWLEETARAARELTIPATVAEEIAEPAGEAPPATSTST